MSAKQYQDSSSLPYWIIGGITIATVALILFFAFKDSLWPKTNREIVKSCTTDMATQFHIHPHLEIFINGEKQEIPANVGIEKSSCMHPLHTHDNTGIIHVESPQKRDFTLDDFFFVWNKKFTKDQILDYKVDDTHTIRQTINGKDVQDYENAVLQDKDEIIIYYEEKK